MIEAIELTSNRRSRGPGGSPVEKVSFDVYPGQVTALLGAPGSGKSAVLRMMAELEPGAGRTLFSGRPYHALRPAVREVGLALNPDAVHPGRTVQAHLQLYSAAGGVPKARIAEVLEIAGLSTQAAVRCGRLDAGQRQRLAIAAALLGDPSALILDEPHALDNHGMSWFHALIRAYAAQGRTVLVAATDPDTLAGTADHVVVLRRDEEDGISRVIASRSAAEVFDEHRAIVVQVRSPQAARLAAALETEGARLSAAGPGALQVRGLDRARIGEVAHVAGICLHELSEIGHDDDVFGLRPVPRQKELLPGLTPVHAEDAGPVAPWSSGVRLIGVAPPSGEIEEAEVIEPAPETAVAVAEAAAETEPAATADRRELAGVPGQPGTQDAAGPGLEDRGQSEVGRARGEQDGSGQAEASRGETGAGQGFGGPSAAESGPGLAEGGQAPTRQDKAGAGQGLGGQVQADLGQALASRGETGIREGFGGPSRADSGHDLAERGQARTGQVETGQRFGDQVQAESGQAFESRGQGEAGGVRASQADSEAEQGLVGQGGAEPGASLPAQDLPESGQAYTSQGNADASEAGQPASSALTAEEPSDPAPSADDIDASRWWQAAAVSLGAADRVQADAGASGGEVLAAVEADQVSSPTATPTPAEQVIDKPTAPPLGSPSSPKRGANRAFGTFRRGRKVADASEEARVVVAAASTPTTPTQPAVPFTVAGGAGPVGDVEGMTPWRAVAVRAGQQQEQGSVVEAASAEQEASA